MNILYLDLFSGVSGDMFVGALLDLGVELPALETELRKLDLSGYHLHARRQQKCGIAGTKFDVHLEDAHGHDHTDDHPHDPSPPDHRHGHDHAHTHSHGHRPGHAHRGADEQGQLPDQNHGHGPTGHRTFRSIRQLIEQSALSPWVREKAVAVFERIAIAEGRIHGLPPGEVHFHEVGAVDSIIDIVLSCLALEQLGRPRVLAGAMVEGSGVLECAHGRYPLPGPATLAILGARGVPITQCEEPNELITPTGAALVVEFAESFRPMEGLVARRIGFGLGTRENRTRPNVLRAILGESITPRSATAAVHDWETDRVAVLETNLDDISGEVLGQFVENTLAAGALDVFHIPVQMKKNRPGILLTVLCPEDQSDRFAELVLRETSAFGVRRTVCERRKLRRRFVSVATPWGEVTVKEGWLDGRVVQAAPEFESCRDLARRSGRTLREVFQAALQSHAKQQTPPDEDPPAPNPNHVH
jgi:pyridinium-3,5-bisthiocarboxylic acid mononucleotide nickel chelatase